MRSTSYKAVAAAPFPCYTVSNKTPITVKVTGDDKYEYFQVYIKETLYTGNIGDADIEIPADNLSSITGPTAIRVQARVKDSNPEQWVTQVIAVNFNN